MDTGGTNRIDLRAMELTRKVERTIREQRLAEHGDSILVAVSGGPDSVALLHILFLLSGQLGVRLIVAHMNHRFRGEESDREAAFVRRMAAEFSLACEVADVDMPAVLAASGDNAQAASRDRRYAFLLEAARRHGANRIALAHHADDQAETVLMRLLRGAGPAGLAGMAFKRSFENVELIRPFLRIYKEELLHYCDVAGLVYCRDSSNDKRIYTRNRLRLDVMPMLRTYNPQLPETLVRLSDVLSHENDYFEREAEACFARLTNAGTDAVVLRRQDFAGLHVALQRRLIKLILNYLASGTGSFDYVKLESIRSAALQETPTTVRLAVSEQITFFREYESVRFALRLPDDAGFSAQLESGGGELSLPLSACTVKAYALNALEPNVTFQPGKYTAAFDSDKLRFPLTVRSRKDGDRIAVIGLNGTKKVKDIFIDEKVSPRLRDRIPLVVDASGRVLWIPGYRRSVHARVTEGTHRLFLIAVEPSRTDDEASGLKTVTPE